MKSINAQSICEWFVVAILAVHIVKSAVLTFLTMKKAK